jgi:hypothetical protein
MSIEPTLPACDRCRLFPDIDGTLLDFAATAGSVVA